MTRKLSILLIPASALVCLMMASPAIAQFEKPEDAIGYRQGAFTIMGTHFGRIAAMAKGKVAFDAKVAADNADIVLTMSKLPFAAFVDGSKKGRNTKAKPEIWDERDKFDQAAKKMQEEVVKLNVAAKSGNLDQIKTAVGSAGKSCKSCHDDYKKK